MINNKIKGDQNFKKNGECHPFTTGLVSIMILKLFETDDNIVSWIVEPDVPSFIHQDKEAQEALNALTTRWCQLLKDKVYGIK